MDGASCGNTKAVLRQFSRDKVSWGNSTTISCLSLAIGEA